MAKYTLYNSNEVPFEVFSLSAFCQEHNLDEQAMRNVVRNRIRQHQGWHLDTSRTNKQAADIGEIEAMLAGTWQPGRGNEFGKPWEPR